MDVWSMVQTGWRPGMMLLGLVFAFVIGLRAMKSFAAPPPEVAALATALPGVEGVELELTSGITAEGVMVSPDGTVHLGPPELTAPVGPSLRDLAIARLEEQPEVSLRLLRAWLKDT
jgi:hypothetical protein